MIADSVFRNGRIYTVDSAHSWAEAVAIKDGRFCYVGTSDAVAAFIGDSTQVIDLHGRMAMPGLHDMHIHGVQGALRVLFQCNFPFTASVTEIATAVADFAKERPDEDWIVGGAWLMNIAPEIHKSVLDAACPDRPVFLWDASHHNGWLNSAALALSDLDPTNEDVVRDANGAPTGLLLEGAATEAWRSVPDRSPADYQAAVTWLAQTLNQLGVTSIKEPAVDRAIAQAYKSLNDAGALNLRTGLHFLWETPFIYDADDMQPLVNDRQQYAGERVKVDFLKLFLDGVPVARTAAMLDPYIGDDPETHDPNALLLVDPETLKEILIRFDALGMTVKMHATGDASMRAALDAIEAARQANGDSGLGHEIAHPQHIASEDIPRVAALGVVPDLCPKLWHLDLNKVNAVTQALGAQRVHESWPLGDYHRTGAMMIAGTDWPAMAPTPSNWLGLQTLITREDPTGAVQGKLGENQELDLVTVIEIYTRNGAVAAGHAEDCGTIEVGKWADMIVLDRNLFEIPVTEIGATQVLRTVLEGETVWQYEDIEDTTD